LVIDYGDPQDLQFKIDDREYGATGQVKIDMGKGARTGRWEAMEFGSWTRRRPIGRDYAAAKDAD
jgi:hypothetical protein